MCEFVFCREVIILCVTFCSLASECEFGVSSGGVLGVCLFRSGSVGRDVCCGPEVGALEVTST